MPACPSSSTPAHARSAPARRAGILRELDRERLSYAFSHALLQRAFYDEVSGARLALLHERAGLALERRRGGVARSVELAHHFAHAAPLGHSERAARYAAAAGRQALAQFANERALEFFREAQRHYAGVTAERERCELAIDVGEALRRVGDASFRRELSAAADRAYALADGQLMGRALLATYRGTFSRAMHVDEAQVARLRSALALLGDGDAPLRARLLALLSTELAWAPHADEGDRASDEALALARALGRRELLAEVLAQRQWSVFHPLSERLATTAELDGLASADLRPTLRFDAAGSSLFTAARVGDRAAAEHALATLRSLAREADQPLVRWMLALREATAALGEARFADAREHVAEGIAIAKRADMRDAGAQRRVQEFWIDVDAQPVEAARSAVGIAARAHRDLSPINWPSLALRCTELGLPAERDAVLATCAAIRCGSRRFAALPRLRPTRATSRFANGCSRSSHRTSASTRTSCSRRSARSPATPGCSLTHWVARTRQSSWRGPSRAIAPSACRRGKRARCSISRRRPPLATPRWPR